MTIDRSNLIFLDTETTGLDPDRHDVWEIGLIRGDTGEEIIWHLIPDLSKADPNALRLTDYYKRVNGPHWAWTDRKHVIKRLAELTAGKHLVGAVPSFDANFLERLLRANSYAPAWHYHLVDVEALMAGKLGIEPPWDTKAMSELMGIPLGRFRQHEALEDARWAKAIYEAVFDKEPA